MEKIFQVTVTAIWDDEAKVWVATSKDIPGLVVEARDTNELEAELRQLVPQLLKLNDGDHQPREIPIRLHQESEFVAAAIA